MELTSIKHQMKSGIIRLLEIVCESLEGELNPALNRKERKVLVGLSLSFDSVLQ